MKEKVTKWQTKTSSVLINTNKNIVVSLYQDGVIEVKSQNPYLLIPITTSPNNTQISFKGVKNPNSQRLTDFYKNYFNKYKNA
jgi:hypothetical protein